MTPLSKDALHLTSTWFIRPGCETLVDRALDGLVAEVHAQEPDTLVYMAHRPVQPQGLTALPPSDPHSVLFFEVYRDVAAFQRHVAGPVFTQFVAQHGDLFVAANGKPFTFVSFLHLHAGFIRELEATAPAAHANHHPAVMFEILANDQPKLLEFYRRVFSWRFAEGTGGFAYVKFPVETLPLLGGIGRANATQPGWEPGRNFYLLVDDLELTIASVKAAGGSAYVDPVSVDGYQFAMVKDPESNVIGLIKPFAAIRPAT